MSSSRKSKNYVISVNFWIFSAFLPPQILFFENNSFISHTLQLNLENSLRYVVGLKSLCYIRDSITLMDLFTRRMPEFVTVPLSTNLQFKLKTYLTGLILFILTIRCRPLKWTYQEEGKWTQYRKYEPKLRSSLSTENCLKEKIMEYTVQVERRIIMYVLVLIFWWFYRFFEGNACMYCMFTCTICHRGNVAGFCNFLSLPNCTQGLPELEAEYVWRSICWPRMEFWRDEAIHRFDVYDFTVTFDILWDRNSTFVDIVLLKVAIIVISGECLLKQKQLISTEQKVELKLVDLIEQSCLPWSLKAT